MRASSRSLKRSTGACAFDAHFGSSASSSLASTTRLREARPHGFARDTPVGLC